MFGFSLAEFILVIIVAIIFIKPQDLPELAKMLGKAVGEIKKLYQNLLAQWQDVAKQPEIASLTQEFQQQVSLAEKNTQTSTETVIIDMYGKEHIVSNIFEVRPDLTKEQLSQEVQEHNKNNNPQ